MDEFGKMMAVAMAVFDRIQDDVNIIRTCPRRYVADRLHELPTGMFIFAGRALLHDPEVTGATFKAIGAGAGMEVPEYLRLRQD